MKKHCIISLFFSLVLASVSCFAQTDAQRTARTKLADALAMMPAQNSETYNALMKDIASTGEDGIIMMARMMNENISGNNSIMEYAINGLSYYVMGLGDENIRRQCAIAYVKAIPQMSNMQVRTFFIQQLQIVGKDEAVPMLRNMLRNESSCVPAAQALAAIKTDPARQALYEALSVSQDKCLLSVVQAIGDAEATVAEKDVLKIVTTTSDQQLKKVALKTLAEIGSKASLKVLANEASKNAYLPEKTGATEAYIQLMKRIAIDPAAAAGMEKDVLALYHKCTTEQLSNTKVSLLELLVAIQGSRAMPLIIQTLKEPNPVVRNAALSFTDAFAAPAIYNQLLEQVTTVSAPVQSEIIDYLGDRDAKEVVAPLIVLIDSLVPPARLNAIAALGRIGGDAAMTRLAGFFVSNKKDDIQAAKQALLTTKSDIEPALQNVCSTASAQGMAAIIEIAGARHLTSYTETIFKLVKSEQPDVKEAAVNALQNIATEKDSDVLCQYLEETGQPYVPALQASVLTSLKSKTTDVQTQTILQHINKIAPEKQLLYYGILAEIGSKQALDTVYKAFADKSGKAKEAAFTALTRWNGFVAAEALIDICKKNAAPEYFERAYAAYIEQVNNTNYPAAEKVVLLRKAMELAKSTEQKRTVLKSLGDNETFMALIAAGKYLDDPALDNDAAWAVANIALANPGFYGADINTLLRKAYAILSGPDSEYKKAALEKHIGELPQTGGFVSLFNGKDLSGWKGLVGTPLTRKTMDAVKLSAEQAKADDIMRKVWSVKDGALLFNGNGSNLCSAKQYGDFEMYIDWMLYPDSKNANAGVCLRGTPRVQIGHMDAQNAKEKAGSGGLCNNETCYAAPLKVADNTLGEWNTFYIKMLGDRVTVYLNGALVADNVIMENAWDGSLPIFPLEQIELYARGKVAYRDIYMREIPRVEPFTLPADEAAAGFQILFDGTNMYQWMGNTQDYVTENGCMVIRPEHGGSGGNLYTKKEYRNFNFRFEFMLTPGANNGVGIRAPLEGDAAYVGMEIQVLDDGAPVYRNLEPYQYHGSVYGVIPAKRGYLKPVGEWNQEEIIVRDNQIIVILNGSTIVNGNISDAIKNGTMDKRDHPGLKNEKGHIGFLGHGSVVWFRNIRIKEF